ncbi:915_t:CDS:1, partial [Scutellospora calospora]
NTSRVVKLPKLSKIRLTPTQTKFIFYGTRGDILKWMEENSSIIVEFDTSEDVFSPPSTPRTLSTPSSPLSSYSDQSFDSKSNSKITFDLFGQQIQNSSIMTDNLAFYRPLHFAMNYLPWLEVILEIRPSEPAKDSKYDPVRRVILNSGITLGEVAKALEKSWKNILPDNCPIKSKLTSISDNGCSIKGKLSSTLDKEDLDKFWKNILSDNSIFKKSKSASTSDNEDELSEAELRQKHHKFLEWLPKTNSWSKFDTEYGNRINSFSIGEAPWIKHRDKSPEVIPPGILTPYNMEEALSNMEH